MDGNAGRTTPVLSEVFRLRGFEPRSCPHRGAEARYDPPGALLREAWQVLFSLRHRLVLVQHSRCDRASQGPAARNFEAGASPLHAIDRSDDPFRASLSGFWPPVGARLPAGSCCPRIPIYRKRNEGKPGCVPALGNCELKNGMAIHAEETRMVSLDSVVCQRVTNPPKSPCHNLYHAA